MITALVHYKKWEKGWHPSINGSFEDRSEIVKVVDLEELNTKFSNITNVEIINVDSFMSEKFKKNTDKIMCDFVDFVGENHFRLVNVLGGVRFWDSESLGLKSTRQLLEIFMDSSNYKQEVFKIGNIDTKK